MHIPDGFVSGEINAAAAIVSTTVLAFSIAQVKKQFKQNDFAVPLLATMAAFVFAAQMLNFPIGGGTSGHFLGAVTAAALLGPWSACIILSIVLCIQCLLFGDGGMTALGSNILNMGIVGGIVVFPLMRGLRAILPEGRRGYFVAVAFGSWVSIVLSSGCCAFELALSKTIPLHLVLPAMVGTHAIIGIGEAMIATAILTAVVAARPDIIPKWAALDGSIPIERRRKGIYGFAGAVMGVALLAVLVGSPFASKAPDGLEKVAEEKGVTAIPAKEQGSWPALQTLFPDYKIENIQSENISTSAAGLIGTIAVFAIGYGVLRCMVGNPELSKKHPGNITDQHLGR